MTLAYAALGTALALLLGGAAALLVSRRWWQAGARPGGELGAGRRLGWLGARGALALPRGVHEVVWGLFLLSLLGPDPLVAVLAIGLPYGAVSAKVFSELIDETDPAAFDALRAAGAGRVQAFLYGLLPAAAPDLIAFAFYRFDCAIRAAAILGIVGAGGIGFQIALSFQELRFAEIWTLLYALIALTGLADLWSGRVRARCRAGARATRAGRDRFLLGSALAALALVAASAWYVGLSPSPLLGGRLWQQLGGVAGASLPPAFGSFGGSELLTLSAQTLAMSILAAAFAAVLGAALGFLGADLGRLTGGGGRRGAGALRRAAVRLSLLFMRAIPPPVWALLCLFVLFPGTPPGALALGVYTLGIVGRLDSESVDDQPPARARALRDLGARPVAILAYAVAPAALPRFAAYAVYRWEVAIRETAVVGAVGAGGLGLLLQERLSRFDYDGAAAVLTLLIALALLVDLLGAALRRAIR